MGVSGYIARSLKQTLVYWANPINDGYGGFTYDDPVEIKGRCEFITEIVPSDEGDEVLSKAHVYLNQEVQEGEYLYLGCLDDSNMDSAPVPSTTEGSMRVIAFAKTPELGSTSKFIYKAYLGARYATK